MKKMIINLVLIVIAISGVVASGQSTNVEASTSHTATSGLFHGDPTNGLGCDIYIDYGTTVDPGNSYHEYPSCIIYIYNHSTNNLHGYRRLPLEAFSEVSLFDSTGQPVKRTMAGEKFAHWWTKEQIHDWLYAQNAKYGDGFSYFSLWSNDSMQHGYFSVSQLFELKQVGEHTLHFQMQLVKNGNVPGTPNYFITVLPEVVAKVEIRPEDIVSTNSVPDIETNAPPK